MSITIKYYITLILFKSSEKIILFCLASILKVNHKNIWESQEALGTLYAMQKRTDTARSLYEKALDTFRAYCKQKSLKINKRVENRLLLKIKRLDELAENINDYNSDEEVELDTNELKMNAKKEKKAGSVDSDDNADETSPSESSGSAKSRSNSVANITHFKNDVPMLISERINNPPTQNGHKLEANSVRYKPLDSAENEPKKEAPKSDVSDAGDNEKETKMFNTHEITDEIVEKGNTRYKNMAVILGEAILIEHKQNQARRFDVEKDAVLNVVPTDSVNNQLEVAKIGEEGSHDLASTTNSNMNMVRSNSSLRKNLDEYKKVMELEEERLKKLEDAEIMTARKTPGDEQVSEKAVSS